MVALCFSVNFAQVPFWVGNDADWAVGCSVMPPEGINFDTSRFAAASYIELDGTVQGSFSFGDSRELFKPCKATDPVIENLYGGLKFSSPIFS